MSNRELKRRHTLQRRRHDAALAKPRGIIELLREWRNDERISEEDQFPTIDDPPPKPEDVL